MIFTDGTMDVLSSFSTINPSILIPEGNVVYSMDPSQSMIAKATLINEFDKQLAIYDLPQFIQTLKMFAGTKVELFDEYANITYDGKMATKFIFAHPNAVNSNAKDVNFPEHQIEFTLTKNMFNNMCKAASTLSLNHIIFTLDTADTILMNVTNADNPTSNCFKTVIPADISSELGEFSVVFHFERLVKMIAKNYTVKISNKMISEFAGVKTAEDDYSIIYHIALATESVLS